MTVFERLFCSLATSPATRPVSNLRDWSDPTDLGGQQSGLMCASPKRISRDAQGNGTDLGMRTWTYMDHFFGLVQQMATGTFSVFLGFSSLLLNQLSICAPQKRTLALPVPNLAPVFGPTSHHHTPRTMKSSDTSLRTVCESHSISETFFCLFFPNGWRRVLV